MHLKEVRKLGKQDKGREKGIRSGFQGDGKENKKVMEKKKKKRGKRGRMRG
jgi:hypothetical protein